MSVIDSLFQLVSMVKEIEEAGLCHCNLCTENVLVEYDMQVRYPETVYLVGFGSATEIFSSEDLNISVWNMPPEMLLERKCDYKSYTVWQLGLILWEMVYGCPPFKSLEAIRENKFTIYRDTEITSNFQALVNACLNPEPERRPTLEWILSHEW